MNHGSVSACNVKNERVHGLLIAAQDHKKQELYDIDDQKKLSLLA